MNSFRYHVETDVRFGKDKIDCLPELIAPYGKRVLMVYGGGSIKRNGIYDKIKELLSDCEVFELNGVEPNPRISTVRKGAEICKKESVDVVLAVGGGSTIDASKVIAAAANYDKDAWDLVTNPEKIEKVLPIVVVLTLAATGSEMNKNAVISNLRNSVLHPIILYQRLRFAILNICIHCLQFRRLREQQILCLMYLNSISARIQVHILRIVLRNLC